MTSFNAPLSLSFFLLFLVSFSSSVSFNRQTLTDPPPSYPYLAAQELLYMRSPMPTVLQVSVEQSIAFDPTATSAWTRPKGQDSATMKDLLLEGVRSFEFDVHYVVELDEGPGVTKTGFRVCKSVTSQVDVEALCSGSLNDDLGINLNTEACQNDGVFPEYGIHAGCRPDSPFLEDVLDSMDTFVADGNPAFATLRFKDFTTGIFVPDEIEFLVQSKLEQVIRDATRNALFSPSTENDVDYTDVNNWPTFAEVIEKGRRLIIFSNSTTNPLVFDDSLLNEQAFVSSAFTRSANNKRQTDEPFFDYTIDTSDQIVIQGQVITSSGDTIEPSDVSSIVSAFRIPSIQRLSFAHLDNLVWGFTEPFIFGDTRNCVIIDPAQGFGWFRATCDQNYFVACANPNTPNTFVFGQVPDNNYETATDVNSYCPASTFHTAPSSPYSNQELVSDAMNSGITTPIYVNMRFATAITNRVVCGCDDGCWFVPGTEVTGLPTTSFCVTPQIEIPIDTEDEVIVNDDDDDLSGGEIAGIVLGSVFFLLLLLILIFLLAFNSRGTRFNEVSGRVGVMVEEEEEDERYKQSRGPLTTAATTAATTKEYPDHKMDLDAQVDLEQEEEDQGPANKRKIGALAVSSTSTRDYRADVDGSK